MHISLSIVSRRAGFTLTELLVVMAIMAVLAIGISSMNFSTVGNQEKKERFWGLITTTIRWEVIKNTSGKALVQSGGQLVFPTKTEVSVSANKIEVLYFSGSTSSPGSVMNAPFYGDPKYTITSIQGLRKTDGSAFSESLNSGALILELANGKDTTLYFSGSTRTDLSRADIVYEYGAFSGTVAVDARTNVIEQK